MDLDFALFRERDVRRALLLNALGVYGIVRRIAFTRKTLLSSNNFKRNIKSCIEILTVPSRESVVFPIDQLSTCLTDTIEFQLKVRRENI